MSETTDRPLIGVPADSWQNPDSPTPYTLYRAPGTYIAALAAAGAAPVIIPLNLPEEALYALFRRLDGLCLAGGVDVAPEEYQQARHPKLGQVDAARDQTELLLARWALEADLPILGICRGIQALNVAAGGTLYQDLPSEPAPALRHDYKPFEVPRERPMHNVRLIEGSRLSRILCVPELRVNSFHHQAVNQPAPGFQVVAWSEDGIVEGIEAPEKRFAVGVQWHPEGMYRTDPLARELFRAFVVAAADGK